MHRRASMSIQTIVVLVIAVVILVTLIVFFTSQSSSYFHSIRGVGDAANRSTGVAIENITHMTYT